MVEVREVRPPAAPRAAAGGNTGQPAV